MPKTLSPIQLQNAQGMRVLIDPLGASLREVWAADARGQWANVALCPLRPGGHITDGSYAGALLAPCAGRIRHGRLPMGGHVHQLACNDGPHQLHGGPQNLSKALWQPQPVEASGDNQNVTFRCEAPHGLDGYPGHRCFTARYTLDNQNTITLEMTATTTAPTWVNLSSHAYWNLSGDFGRSALHQLLHIAAEEAFANDEDHLPAERRPVAGTTLDFCSPTPIGQRLEAFAHDPQVRIGRGLNNAFVLTGAQPCATLLDPTSGRRLRLYTDHPALVLYTGGFLGGDTVLPGGLSATPGCAIALEAQEFPDAPNLPGVPAPMLSPGEVRRRFIRFALDWVAVP